MEEFYFCAPVLKLTTSESLKSNSAVLTSAITPPHSKVFIFLQKIFSFQLSSSQRQTEWRVSILVMESPGDIFSSSLLDIILSPYIDEDQTYHGHYTIHNLRPGSTYQLEIRARNGYGWSQLSKLHTFFTLSGDLNQCNVAFFSITPFTLCILLV